MPRTTFTVMVLASAACGVDVVGQAAETTPGAPTASTAPSAPTASPTATSDAATPGGPVSDGGAGGGAGPGPVPDPTPTSSLTLTSGALPTSANVDLTALGGVDWVSWGKPKTRKSTPAQAIIGFTTSGSADCTAYDFPCSLEWSDGTAPASFAGHAGRCIFAPDSFYAFDVLATTKLRTLTLLFGAYQARGKLTVTLSDGTPAQTDASLDNKTESMATIQYVVTFSAAGATGVSLHVDWRDDSHRLNGSVYLGSAAVHE
ncbi:MAG: hypothetical protein U0270_20275 [Labilithrix sp.]